MPKRYWNRRPGMPSISRYADVTAAGSSLTVDIHLAVPDRPRLEREIPWFRQSLCAFWWFSRSERVRVLMQCKNAPLVLFFNLGSTDPFKSANVVFLNSLDGTFCL